MCSATAGDNAYIAGTLETCSTIGAGTAVSMSAAGEAYYTCGAPVVTGTRLPAMSTNCNFWITSTPMTFLQCPGSSQRCVGCRAQRQQVPVGAATVPAVAGATHSSQVRAPRTLQPEFALRRFLHKCERREGVSLIVCGCQMLGHSRRYRAVRDQRGRHVPDRGSGRPWWLQHVRAHHRGWRGTGGETAAGAGVAYVASWAAASPPESAESSTRGAESKQQEPRVPDPPWLPRQSGESIVQVSTRPLSTRHP